MEAPRPRHHLTSQSKLASPRPMHLLTSQTNLAAPLPPQQRRHHRSRRSPSRSAGTVDRKWHLTGGALRTWSDGHARTCTVGRSCNEDMHTKASYCRALVGLLARLLSQGSWCVGLYIVGCDRHAWVRTWLLECWSRLRVKDCYRRDQVKRSIGANTYGCDGGSETSTHLLRSDHGTHPTAHTTAGYILTTWPTPVRR